MPEEPEQFVRELIALPETDRQKRFVTQAGDKPGDLLQSLCAEVERLAVTEVTAAQKAGAALVALAETLGNSKDLSCAYRVCGRAMAYAGKAGESLKLCEQAIRVAEEHQLIREAALARMAAMQPLSVLGAHQQVRKVGDEARDSFVALGETAMAARVDANLGGVCLNIGDPESALEYFERARPALEDDPVGLALVNSNLGLAYLHIENYRKSEEVFREALPVLNDASIHWAAAMVEGNLAELCTRQGRIQEAFAHFERTRRHLEHDESPEEMARVLSEHASALLLVGLNEEALRQFTTALERLLQTGQPVEIAKASIGRAEAAIRLGTYDIAASSLKTTADVLRDAEQNGLRARAETLHAEMALATDDFAAAVSHANNVMNFVEGRPVATAMARALAARIALESGNENTALLELDAALPIAEFFEITPLRAELLHLRGLIRRQLGDAANALVDLRESVLCVERTRNSIQAERFRTAFQGERLGVYSDLIDLALQSEDEEALRLAFETTERAKSRALLELARKIVDPAVAARNAEDSQEAELSAALTESRQRLEQIYSKIAEDRFGSKEQFVRDEMRTEIRALESSIGELEARLSTSGDGASLTKALTVDEIRDRLQPEEAIIEYFIKNDELIGFYLTKSKLICRTLVHVPELIDALKRLRFQMQKGLRQIPAGPRHDRLIADVKRELGGLYDRLLRPFPLNDEKISRLRIVPHGPLHSLAFHALWDGTAYLVERFEVGVAPSASFMLLAETREVKNDGDTLVVGVADELAPNIAREAQEIAALFQTPVILTGAIASAECVCEKLMHATYAHIACHGQYVSDTPAASGLLMADRWLTVREIQKLRLRARLVTLSGCETGRVDVEQGDEIVGLLRPFLVAGARSLLVSFWTVSDACTLEFMKRFYTALLDADDQHTVLSALRAAQRAQLTATPHPALWGSFCLVGA